MDKEWGKAQVALKDQRLVTTENFDNERLDKGQLGIYFQFIFLAKEDISDVQTCSVFFVRKKIPHQYNPELKEKKGKLVETKAVYKAVLIQT